MTDEYWEQLCLNRRTFLIGMSAAALSLTFGCGIFRRRSDLDKAYADLEDLLDRAPSDDTEQLATIAKSIRFQSKTLVDTHETFVDNFNEKATDRGVAPEELQSLVSDYEVRRQALRNRLLRLQDELHDALPPDAWPDVLKVLNRKGKVIASRNISET